MVHNFTADEMLSRLDKPDKELALEGYLEWFREVMAKPDVDLSAMPEHAFLAGFAYAIQFRWE